VVYLNPFIFPFFFKRGEKPLISIATQAAMVLLMPEPLISGLNPDFWYNAIFAFVDIAFAIMLWIVDNRSKKRQNESMKRQDESIDIILEQISKVNTFQTIVLSYAIETLEKDMEEIKVAINQKFSPATAEPSVAAPSRPAEAVETGSPPAPSLGEAITSRFQAVLRDQLGGMLNGIKKSLGEIPETSEKEAYKVKKGLEFDLKHLLRGLEDLEKTYGTGKTAEPRKEDQKVSSHDDEDVEVLEDDYGTVGAGAKETAAVPPLETGKEQEKERKTPRIAFSEIEQEVDGLESLKDLGSFANSILKTISQGLDFDFQQDKPVDAAGLKKDLEEMKKERQLYKQKRRKLKKKQAEDKKESRGKKHPEFKDD